MGIDENNPANMHFHIRQLKHPPAASRDGKGYRFENQLL
jgi:hypothetical protein